MPRAHARYRVITNLRVGERNDHRVDKGCEQGQRIEFKTECFRVLCGYNQRKGGVLVLIMSLFMHVRGQAVRSVRYRRRTHRYAAFYSKTFNFFYDDLESCAVDSYFSNNLAPFPLTWIPFKFAVCKYWTMTL